MAINRTLASHHMTYKNQMEHWATYSISYACTCALPLSTSANWQHSGHTPTWVLLFLLHRSWDISIVPRPLERLVRLNKHLRIIWNPCSTNPRRNWARAYPQLAPKIRALFPFPRREATLRTFSLGQDASISRTKWSPAPWKTRLRYRQKQCLNFLSSSVGLRAPASFALCVTSGTERKLPRNTRQATRWTITCTRAV